MFRFYTIPASPVVRRPTVNPFLRTLFDDEDRYEPDLSLRPLFLPLRSAYAPCKRARPEDCGACFGACDADECALRDHDDGDDEPQQERVIQFKKPAAKPAQQAAKPAAAAPAVPKTAVAAPAPAPAPVAKPEEKRVKRARTEEDPFALCLASLDSLSSLNPGLEVKESDAAWLVSLRAPGGGSLQPDQLDVSVEPDKGLLTIKGQSSSESKREGAGFSYVQRSSTSFSRSVPLPRDVDEEAISAQLDAEGRGVTVTLPKRAKRAQAKSIAVQPASKPKPASPTSASASASASAPAPVSASPGTSETKETKEAKDEKAPAAAPAPASTPAVSASASAPAATPSTAAASVDTMLPKLPEPVMERVAAYVGDAAPAPAPAPMATDP